MKLDLTELLKKERAVEELHLEINEEKLYDGSEYINLAESIKLDGTLSKVGDILTLNSDIHTVLEFNCSRCLGKFSYPIEMTIEEKFTTSDKVNKDDDLIFINSDTLDITEIIENNIILTLPIKRLCKEDCKGLCHKCGANLNFSTCQCKNDDFDPRLAKLKDLFLTD